MFDSASLQVHSSRDLPQKHGLEVALQGTSFSALLVLLMDRMNIPGNDNSAGRLYSITAQQIDDFDNLYDLDAGFRNVILAFQEMVLRNGGGPFTAVVTPENSPGCNAGNGGNTDGAPPAHFHE